MLDFLGKTIHHYRIEGLVGEGGMGSVYVGVHETTLQKVAIKILYNINPQNNQERAKRFAREASILAKLEHPNIVKVRDFVEDETGRYIIMEYVEGKPVDDLLRIRDEAGRLQATETIFLQLLEGVGYAHQQNVIHRDLKPSNILINRQLNVKLLDFGVAKLQEEEKLQLTRTGSSVGTTYYMSPEQVKGQKLEVTSDIYSLGLILYEMISGENPFADPALTHYEINQKIVKESLPKLSLQDKNLSDRLNRVIQRATHKSPSQRFRNCEEFKSHFKFAMGLELTPAEMRLVKQPRRISPKWLVISITVFSASVATVFMLTATNGDKFQNAGEIPYFRKDTNRYVYNGTRTIQPKDSVYEVEVIPADTGLTQNPVIPSDAAKPSSQIKASLIFEAIGPGKFKVYYTLTNLSNQDFPRTPIRLDYYDEFGYVRGETLLVSVAPNETREGSHTVEAAEVLKNAKIRVLDEGKNTYYKQNP